MFAKIMARVGVVAGQVTPLTKQAMRIAAVRDAASQIVIR